MSAVAVLTVAALTWFGPAQVAFDAALPGNPYDFRANDVRVRFVAADGHTEERLAYFDNGRWKAWLVTPHPADYTATLVRNGVPVPGATPAHAVIADTARVSAGGFVRVRGTRFVSDDGTPYFPLGHNLGWQDPAAPPLVQQLRAMGATGMNWTRIWACAWDGKNPFVPADEAAAPAPGELLPAALRQWDGIITTAERSGVRLQLVLFHHGLFSSDVNTNWPAHPWNAANGGFLKRPQDFFTDRTARDYTQRWLRHAVARWGHSPAILAWELFNEVEWVDRVRQDHDWKTVAAWHADMAAFLRALDPYDHLITTSSATEYPELYDAMDFVQPHIYTRNLTVAIAGSTPLAGKPWFFGEFGGDAHGPAVADENQFARDGLWAGVLAGHAGAGGFWYWERVAQQHFAHEFTRVARALALSGLPARLEAKPISVALTGALPAPLVVAPGRGWGTNGLTDIRLPEDVAPRQLAQLSSYLRAPDPKRPGTTVPPLALHFNAPMAGEATIALLGTGARGGSLRITLDGPVVASPSWPARKPGKAQPEIEPVVVPYPAGSHVLAIHSTGPDWVQLDRIVLPDLGRTSTAMAIGTTDFVMARVTTADEGVCVLLGLQFPGLADGRYTLTTLDLDHGVEAQRAVEITHSTLQLPILQRDLVVILTP